MTPTLLNLPRSEGDFNIWGFAHSQDHGEIVQAAGQKNIALQNYIIYPISPADVAGFLDRHQQYHIDMNNALGLPSVDLSDVDFNNERQFEAWLYLNWQEHQAARAQLGI